MDCSELVLRSVKCFALFSVATDTLELLRMLFRTEFPLRSLMIMTALSFLMMLRLFRLSLSAWKEGGEVLECLVYYILGPKLLLVMGCVKLGEKNCVQLPSMGEQNAN